MAFSELKNSWREFLEQDDQVGGRKKSCSHKSTFHCCKQKKVFSAFFNQYIGTKPFLGKPFFWIYVQNRLTNGLVPLCFEFFNLFLFFYPDVTNLVREDPSARSFITWWRGVTTNFGRNGFQKNDLSQIYQLFLIFSFFP